MNDIPNPVVSFSHVRSEKGGRKMGAATERETEMRKNQNRMKYLATCKIPIKRTHSSILILLTTIDIVMVIPLGDATPWPTYSSRQLYITHH